MRRSSLVNGATTRRRRRHPTYTDFLGSARINSALRIVAQKFGHELFVIPTAVSQFCTPEMVGISRNAGDLLSDPINRLVAHLRVLSRTFRCHFCLHTFHLPAAPKLGFKLGNKIRINVEHNATVSDWFCKQRIHQVDQQEWFLRSQAEIQTSSRVVNSDCIVAAQIQP